MKTLPVALSLFVLRMSTRIQPIFFVGFCPVFVKRKEFIAEIFSKN